MDAMDWAGFFETLMGIFAGIFAALLPLLFFL